MPATHSSSEPPSRSSRIVEDRRARELKRADQFEIVGVDAEARTVEMSVASGADVERWFGLERLEMSEKACDLSRLNAGAAVLHNHNWDQQIGVVEKAWIDTKTKTLRVQARFSDVGLGAEIFQDIRNGIRRLVSIGYVVRKTQLVSETAGVETHLVTDWQVFEVSVVAVPADPNVGVGRSFNPQPSISMSSTPAPAANEAAEIMGSADVLAARHPHQRDELYAAASQHVRENRTSKEYGLHVLKHVLPTRGTFAPANLNGGALGLSRNDMAAYSVMKVIRSKLENRPIDGLELEASRAEAKRLGREPEGIFIPPEVFAAGRQRSLSATGDTADGGYTISSTVDTANMVSLLRNSSHVLALGARTLTGLTGDVSIPRVISGGTVYWVAEDGTITSGNPKFGQIVAKPRRLGGRTQYTKQWLAQTSLDAESFVRDDLMSAMGVELDRVAINGKGGAEPLGILNLENVNRSTSVTFGGAASLTKLVEFETNVGTANALIGNPAFLTTPATKGKWRCIQRFTNAGVGLWATDEDVAGYRGRATNQFPSTPTANQSIFGDFSQVLFMEWAGIDIVVDPYTAAAEHKVWVTIQKLTDMIIRQGKAFSISTDSGAQ